MAVQKSRKSRSKRNMRRNHQKLSTFQISTDQNTGELHLRHHLTASGYYKGKCIINKTTAAVSDEE